MGTKYLIGVHCYNRLKNEQAKFAAAKAVGVKTVHLGIFLQDVIAPSSEPGVDRSGLPAIDRAVGWCRDLGLKVILLEHVWDDNSNGYAAYGTFLSNATEQATWLNAWKTIVNRYKNEPTVVGIDIMDEPYTMARANNPRPATVPDPQGAWEAIAEDAVAQLKSINPNLLFIVEGFPAWRDTAFLKGANVAFSDHIFYHDQISWQPWAQAYAAGDLAGGKVLLEQLIDTKWMILVNQGISFWMGATGFLATDPNWNVVLDDMINLLVAKGLGYSVYTFACLPWSDPYDMIDHNLTGYQLTPVGSAVSAHFLAVPPQPPHALIEGVVAPSGALAGSAFVLGVNLRNDGTGAGVLKAVVIDRDTGGVVGTEGSTPNVLPNGTGTLNWNMTMVNHDWHLQVRARSDGTVESTADLDILLQAPPTAAHALVEAVDAPAEAAPGSSVAITAHVKNDGGSPGILNARITDLDTGTAIGVEQPTAQLSPAGTALLSWDLIAPDHDWHLIAEARSDGTVESSRVFTIKALTPTAPQIPAAAAALGLSATLLIGTLLLGG